MSSLRVNKFMWRAAEHSDSENSLWLLLRSIEWIQWPLFISQPIVPILLWFFDWQPVVVAVVVIAMFWRLVIANRFVSVRLADFGPIFVLFKFPICPVMAFLIWRQGDLFGAALALLWPFAVLLIERLLNISRRMAAAVVHHNVLQIEFDAIQNRFKARLLIDRAPQSEGVKSTMTSNRKLELLTLIVISVLFTTSWVLEGEGVIPLWGAMVSMIAALLVSGLVACFMVWCFLGSERYLDFIKKAKSEQNELLERRRQRREQRKKA